MFDNLKDLLRALGELGDLGFMVQGNRDGSNSTSISMVMVPAIGVGLVLAIVMVVV